MTLGFRGDSVLCIPSTCWLQIFLILCFKIEYVMSAETQIKTGTSYWNQTVQAVWYQALISQRFKTCKLTLAIAKWKNPTVCRQTIWKLTWHAALLPDGSGRERPLWCPESWKKIEGLTEERTVEEGCISPRAQRQKVVNKHIPSSGWLWYVPWTYARVKYTHIYW